MLKIGNVRLPANWENGKLGSVKVTAELPNDLVRMIKMRALNEGMKFKDMLELLLRQAVTTPGAYTRKSRKPTISTDSDTGLPVIHCTKQIGPEDASPARLHQILLDQEVEWAS